ncbi:MAG: STAS domain-containing protein [Planctomycetota bacterium]
MIDIQTYPHGSDVLVVMLRGDLGVNDVKDLQARLDREMTDEFNKLVLDCGKLNSISSMGLGMLVRMQSRLKAKDGEVRLANVQKIVAEVLAIMKLDKVFGIYPSIDAAAKSMA